MPFLSRNVFATFALTAAALISPVRAQAEHPVSELSTVLLAANQPYLSQQTMKAYAQMGANVTPDKAGAILKQALADLQSNFGELKQAAPAAVAPLLEQQRKLMDQLAGVEAQSPTPANLASAVKISDELLAAADATTKAIAGKSPPAAMLMMAARQRLLSQQVATAYFLQQTPLKSPDIRRRLDITHQEFHNLISTFDDHKADIPGIENSIELARMQMVFLDNAVSAVDNANPRQMSTVATANERVLSQMIDLTKSMQKHLDEQSPRVAKK